MKLTTCDQISIDGAITGNCMHKLN